MEELKKEMNAAYNLIDAIPVRGNMIEVMAEARQHLRAAYKLAEENDPQSQKIATGSFEAHFVEEKSENG